MRPFSIVIAWLLSAGMAAADTFFDETVLPVLRRHCMDCHEPEDSEGDVIFLDAKRPADLEKRRVVWKSVAEQLRNRTMPPPKRASQPDELERMQVSEWIHHYLRQSASRSAPYAGWVKARRLNRTEYDHTIRDLLGVNLNFAETFPMEGGGGEGFDNNSETLFLPPLLMERFMEAAQQVADAAIVSPRLQRRFRPEELLPKEKPAVTGGRKLDGPGEVSLLLPVHVAGEFELRIEAGSGEGQVSELEISVDGIRTDTVRLAGGTDALPDAGPVRQSLRLTRGLHAVSFRSVGPGLIVLHAVEIEENRPSVGAERRASHRRLLGLDPGESPVALRALARERLEHMVERAFRRPLRAREVDRFMKLFDRATERGDSFEEGMKLALKGVLVSPEFLFRLEAPAKGAEIEPLGDFELASRLSYFLWSTMPDDALWQAAGSGRLRQEGGLKLEMDRMLKDPRSRVFARSFVGQWLGTKDVGGRVAPTQNAIQHFYTPEVAAAMREEIIRFFHELVLRDRSVLDLIDADYTYMSGRLAKFYERDDWKDFRMDEFEQVSLGDGRRGGLLGMGAVLALTSHFKQTSPILRGAWILDTLLGTPVPPPPPNVPPAPKKDARGRKLTAREMLAQHRENTACAACHNLIDPIGFGLENFDFLGRWREEADGAPVDASGRLPSGETFTGPKELKKVLLARKDIFLRHLVRKVLGYALGRSLVEQDEGTIEKIAQRVEERGHGARQLIEEVIFCTPFRNKQLLEGGP